MPGTPIKTEMRRLMREAILRGAKEGKDPVDYMVPYADKLRKMALEGEDNSAVTLGALKEIADRVDGRSGQETEGGGRSAPTLVIEIVDHRSVEKVIEGVVVKEVEKG